MQRNWSPTTEQELLLQAALGSGPAAVSAWRQWKAITDFDHYLDDDSFELLPLLYMNLRRHGVKDPLIHKLKGIYRRLWCENQLQFRVLAESLDRLNRAELPTLLLDAAGLSAKYYREPGLRKIKRSQVAVPVTRAKLATRVLAQSGWAIPARNDERHRFEQSVIFVNDSGRELEIRWDLALEQSEAGSFSWRDAVPVSFAGVSTHAHAPTQIMCNILLGPLSESGQRGIVWIADSVAVLNCPESAVDWGTVIEVARKRWSVGPLKTRVELLYRLFPNAIPAAAASAVRKIRLSPLERLEARHRLRSSAGSSLAVQATSAVYRMPTVFRDKVRAGRDSIEKTMRTYSDRPLRLRCVEAVLAKLTGIETYVANYVMKSSEYRFSQDYVSDRASVWNEHLAGFSGKENLNMLEIGSFEGRSAIWFLTHILTHPSSTLTCIDLFEHRIIELRFDHNIRVSGFLRRVRKIKGNSHEVLKVLKEKNFDLIYIDAGHRAEDVRADACSGWRLLKPGGFVVFDDYLWEPERPAEDRPQIAIDEFLNEFASEVEILHHGFQVIVRKIPPALHRSSGADLSSLELV